MSDRGFLTGGNREHVTLLNPVIAVNNTGNGKMVIDTVGENVDPGEILTLKDGKYWLADANLIGLMPAQVMAMETILADASGLLLHCGYYRHDDWDWTPGDGEANLLWASATPGAMSPDQPAVTGDQVQVVAYIRTADVVFFNPSYELVEAP